MKNIHRLTNLNLFIALFLMAPALLVGQVSFEEHEISGATTHPDHMIQTEMVDINEDGHLDIVFINDLSWHEYDPVDKKFLGLKRIDHDIDYIRNMTFSDLDLDGDLDLVASNFEGLVWLENLGGTANYAPQRILHEEVRGLLVLCMDVENDGDVDIIQFVSPNKTRIYLNDGTENFTLSEAQFFGTTNIKYVQIVDLNEDSFQDMLYSSPSTTDYYLNDGMGGFERIWLSSGIEDRTSAYSADMNSDGYNDLIISGDGGTYIKYGNEIPGEWGETYSITSFSSASFMRVQDFDNDGDNDIVLARSNGAMAWVENIENGNDYTLHYLANNYSLYVTDIEVIDIDMDGDLDLISALHEEEKLGIHEFDEGDFLPIAYPFDYNDDVESLELVDLDNDGDLDVLCASRSDDKVSWYENMDGKGKYSPQILIRNDIGKAYYATTGDLDNDGDLDIVCGSQLAEKIFWLENNGDAKFELPQVIGEGLESTGSHLFVADADGDSDLDVIYVSQYDGEVGWFANEDGNGIFGAYQGTIGWNYELNSADLGDIDGDGLMDVIGASLYHKGIYFYNLHLNSSKKLFYSSNPYGSIIGDVNSDSLADVYYFNKDLDVAFCSQKNSELNPHQDWLSIIVSDQIPGYSDILDAFDIDGDGDEDLLFNTTLNLIWLENLDGEGLFGVNQEIPISENLSKEVSDHGDIDNDGDLDFLIGYQDNVSWFENKGLNQNEIIGSVRLIEEDSVCHIDAGIPIKDVLVTAENEIISRTSSTIKNGIFQIFVPNGEYTTDITKKISDFFEYEVIPDSYSLFDSLHQVDTMHFCVIGDDNINNASISMYPLFQLSPGFNFYLGVVIHNHSTNTMNGDFKVLFTPDKVEIKEENDTNTQVGENEITISFADLLPFEKRLFQIEFEVNAPPVVNIDDILHFSSTLSTNVTESDYSDNNIVLNEKVVGSFDPNDIRIVEGDEIAIEDKNKDVHLIIRFQNTGNADAINVEIKNKLHENMDFNTLEIEAASHPFQLEIHDRSRMKFVFENINLPGKEVNEEESHGFVAYKIKPIENVSVGDKIESVASIIFDYNIPVVTNIATTQFVEEILDVAENEKVFEILPTLVHDRFILKSKENGFQILVYDVNGQIVLEGKENTFLDLSDSKSGVYFVKILKSNKYLDLVKIIKM